MVTICVILLFQKIQKSKSYLLDRRNELPSTVRDKRTKERKREDNLSIDCKSNHLLLYYLYIYIFLYIFIYIFILFYYYIIYIFILFYIIILFIYLYLFHIIYLYIYIILYYYIIYIFIFILYYLFIYLYIFHSNYIIYNLCYRRFKKFIIKTLKNRANYHRASTVSR